MSAAYQPAAGYDEMLSSWTDGLVAFAHLYTNDPEFAPGLTADVFVEPVYEGYTSLPVERWTPPAKKDGRSFSVCDPIIFTLQTGPPPAPIRGYYVTSGRDGPLLWCWRNPEGAFVMGPATPTVIVYVTARWPFLLG